jgi:hypothetical protein
MRRMGLIRRLRTLFSSSALDDEAAEREEYGLLADRGAAELRRDRFGPLPSAEAAETAEDELQELEPPHDPNP